MSKRDLSREKKASILDGATRLLRTRGLQALSFENIAAEADMSRQLVRYYYSDMEALVVDLCDHLAGTYREILVTGVVEVGQVERLDFFLDFFFGVTEAYPMPDNLEVYDAFFAFAVGSGKVRNRLCDIYKMLGQVFIHELSIAHPDIKDYAAEELSFVFVSMMHAHWSYVATLGYADGHGRITRDAMDRLIKSYTEHPAEAPQIDKAWTRKV